jgi:Cytochrome c7 and related cytochrome c
MEVLTNRMSDTTMIRRGHRRYILGGVAALALALTPAAFAQSKDAKAAKPGAKKSAAPAGDQSAGGSKEFFIHAFHAEKLQGLECSLCHTAAKEGSVELKRPGHDQCKACHADDFDKDIKQIVCAQCHSAFPPSGASDLVPFPRYKSTRAILFQFSHRQHVDQKARVNPTTGFRADCTFCHKFDEKGIFATFPGHTQCAACHANAGMKPKLDASLDAEGCRGCHTPEEIENPGFTEQRRMVAQVAVSGKYVDIKFSHIAHFKVKQQFGINCTTCHYSIPRSSSLADLSLPRMLDCVECHDTSKSMPAEFRMSNCTTCHADTVQGMRAPASHARNVKPAFHTESFRIHHNEEASAPDAKCFVCHQNVTPSVEAKTQCASCHIVMKPASHTARWKDDIHGKYAALERRNCATCHSVDYCSRCHNELPRSHVPLPIFKGGGHAGPAMLDIRACLTCHTFQNTCAQCHARGLNPAAVAK